MKPLYFPFRSGKILSIKAKWPVSTMAFFVLCLAFSPHLTAATCTWTNANGTGLWNDPLNWDCGVVPDADDDVVLSSGSANMNVAATVNDVTYSGGKITGANALTVNGTMEWEDQDVEAPLVIASGGILNIAAGADNLDVQLTINAGGTANQNGSLTIQAGGSIVNNGTFNQVSGSLHMNNSSVTVDNNGTFDVSHDGTTLSGSGLFTNTGTFTWSAGAGTLEVNCDFTNDGTFNQNTGTNLDFNSTPFIHNGTLNLQPDATLETGTSTINVAISNGANQTWDIDGDITFTVPLTINGTINIDRRLISASETFTLNGTANWTGGDIEMATVITSGAVMHRTTGGGQLEKSLTINSGGTFNQSQTITIQLGGSIVNNGIFNQTAGTLHINNPSVTIDNNGTFEVSHDGSTLSGSGLFTNTGTFTWSAGAGTLEVNCDFTNDGTFNQNTGTKLDFNSTPFIHNGTLNLQSDVTLETGQTTINAAIPNGANQTWNIFGDNTFNVPLTINGTVNINQRLISASETFTLNGTANWTGGDLEMATVITSGAVMHRTTGGGQLEKSLTINSGGTFNQSQTITIQLGGSIVNNGTFNQTAGSLHMNNSSVTFDNNGTFEVSHDGTTLGGNGLFTNTGTFTWSAGAGTLTVGSDFTNDGVFNQNTGTKLDFNSTPFIHNGTLNLQSDVTLETGLSTINSAIPNGANQTWNIFGDNTFNVPLTINGTVNINNRLISTSEIFTLNGTAEWTGGDIEMETIVASGGIFNHPSGGGNLEKNLTVNSGGIFNQSSSITFFGSVTITNHGTFNKSGGSLFMNGSTPKIDNFGLFDVTHDGTAVSGNGTFTNKSGSTFTRSAGSGTMTIGCPFTNQGTFNFNTGSQLDFTRHFIQNGTFNLNGTVLMRTLSTSAVGTTFTLGPDVEWEIEQAMALNTSIFVEGEIEMKGSNCSITNAGPAVAVGVKSGGVFRWEDGNLLSRVDVDEGGFFLAHFSGKHTLDKGVLIKLGAMYSHHADAEIEFGEDGFILNQGDIQFALTGVPYTPFSGNGCMQNDNQFTTTGTGTMNISSNFVNSIGAVIQQNEAGTVNFSQGFTNSGTVAGIGTLNFTNLTGWTGSTAPGLSPGLLNLSEVDLTNSSLLHIELQDDGDGNPATTGTPGTHFDQVAVAGAATLGGILDLNLLSGFMPTVGNQWTIMTCNPCSGSFTSIQHPGTNPNAFSVAIVGGNQVVLTMSQPLPVELLGFDLSKNENGVWLDWATASETDNRGFEIQSAVGSPQSPAMEWETIGFVEGRGTAAGENEYRFLHDAPYDGINYYRLRQMDFDGHINDSPVRSILWENKKGNPYFDISPNPVSELLNVNFSEKYEGGIYAEIYDASGQLFFSKNINGNIKMEFDVSDFPAGLYFLKIKMDGELYVEKIMVE